MSDRKDFLNTFLLAFFYGLFIYVLNYCLFQRTICSELPDAEQLSTVLDTGFYNSIAQKGYEFNDGPSNSAFFYLFPLVWHISHLDGLWISFLNMAFFALGFAIFCRLYKFSTIEKLVIISFPSLYFCFVPYTEALFILLVCLLFWAIIRQKRYVVWLSLFLVSQVRPTAMVLLPAFLIMELITNERRSVLRSIGSFFVNYAWPLMLGLVFFIWLQHYQTGVWFAFFKQEKYWGHEFSWPKIPFNSMYGQRLLWLNSVAMFIGTVSLVILIIYGLKWLFRNIAQQDKILVLSFLYMTAMLLETIFFNPKWAVSATNVYDIHRYLFVTPFFWVFLHKYTKDIVYKPLHYLYMILASNAFWFLFGSYRHITYVFYFDFGTALIVLYMLHANKKLTWPAMFIFGINLIFCIHMFQFFLQGFYHG